MVQRHAACRLPLQAAPLADKASAQLVEAEREQTRSRRAVKIATFNINNVNRRLPNLLNWLAAAKPDAVCLQELKAEDQAVPIGGASAKRATERYGRASGNGTGWPSSGGERSLS